MITPFREHDHRDRDDQKQTIVRNPASHGRILARAATSFRYFFPLLPYDWTQANIDAAILGASFLRVVR